MPTPHVLVPGKGLRVVGLFAGIGGIEVGFEAAGHEAVLLCENDRAANLVLDARFPRVRRHDDVTTLEALPEADVVTAGFPCQDLSQAGRTAGIRGTRSGLVEHVFELLDEAEAKAEPAWVVLENVSFMLQLDQGKAMDYLTHQFGRRGYTWAYRTVDTRAFGLPQRRQRVLFAASKMVDPRPALFAEDAGPHERTLEEAEACGFYWTEGLRGLGWAIDAVPTLKGGSTIGIPSPPGVWRRATGELGTPTITDAERLQGFAPDWTSPAEGLGRKGPRWKLVGNAVSVPVAEWLGGRLVSTDSWSGEGVERVGSGSWPSAAWGRRDRAFVVEASKWPVRQSFLPLAQFLDQDLQPLSHRAASGFLQRTRRAKLRFVDAFIRDVERHVERTAQLAAA